MFCCPHLQSEQVCSIHHLVDTLPCLIHLPFTTTTRTHKERMVRMSHAPSREGSVDGDKTVKFGGSGGMIKLLHKAPTSIWL